MRNSIVMLSLVILTLLNAGCAGSQSGVDVTSPEEVHRQWVDNLRANQRDALLDLAAPQQLPDAFVDDTLRAIQTLVNSDDHGELLTIETQPLSDAVVAKVGVSVWIFADGTQRCYRTEIVTVDNLWKVLRFGGLLQCPMATSDE